MTPSQLLAKYDVPVPRYTSYPTVPYWKDSPTTEEWIAFLNRALSRPDATWAIYLHIPFCETLCTFCGCNTMITKNHSLEAPYVGHLLDEFALYQEQVPALKERPLKQIHLGGGTPTFLSADSLKGLIEKLFSRLQLQKDFEGSLEVDPRRTRQDQLAVLRELGFTRVSMGVQDFNPEVQRLVNRIQPFEMTEELTRVARELGYESVNFDLIYGLPKQSLDSFSQTIDQTIALRPDRIALYSFALVPWIKPQQRLFKDSDLPMGAAKRELYEMAYNKFLAAGYVEIGMDHFALPTDALAKAQKEARLHRNFMGYTESRTDVLLGLGVSSISETPECFHQNEKVLPVYERRVNEKQIPTLRGHKLSAEDQKQREKILKFMTVGHVELEDDAEVADAREFLRDLFEDGLVELEDRTFKLTEKGRPFLRNACVVFDKRLRSQKPTTKVFSQAL